MKTYVLIVSEFFPKTHNKAGLPTGFINSILNQTKKHTIRGNYQLWKKRFNEIEKGNACLSLRYWNVKPYNSKQKEVYKYVNTDGIGIEKIEFKEMVMTTQDNIITKTKKGHCIWVTEKAKLNELAKNDGLTLPEFKCWFSKYDLSQPMAIIHLTNFRYEKPNKSKLL
jgi:hypothetical protein